MLWFKGEWGLKVFFERFFLKGESMEPFTVWAFGEDYTQFVVPAEFLNAWNDRHGHLLLLGINGTIAEDAEKMYAEYVKFTADPSYGMVHKPA